MKNKYHAFTLAETLITIGIIGILAAMTIPTLIKKYKDARHSAILKEDYSILQQMMKRANDEGAMANIVIGNNMDEMKNWFNTYLLPYVKTSSVCYDSWGCWSKNVKNSSGSIYTNNTACGYRSISFVLYNGSYICMDDYNPILFGITQDYPGQIALALFIDVNGEKKPNTFGKDIFVTVFKEEELLPGGYNATKQEVNQNCSPNCQGTYCGTYCLVKAQRQGFKLPIMED